MAMHTHNTGGNIYLENREFIVGVGIVCGGCLWIVCLVVLILQILQVCHVFEGLGKAVHAFV
jgi:hypothetical protein